MQTTVAPSRAQSTTRPRLIRRPARTVGDLRPRVQKPAARRGLESFFAWGKGKAPEHLVTICGLLGVRSEYPWATWDEDSGYLSKLSDLKCQPGAYLVRSDGIAKVLVVGKWKKGLYTPSSFDTFQRPNKPQDCRSFSLPQFYAHRLGLEREYPEEHPKAGQKYVPRAVYNALAALLVLRSGAAPSGELFDGLADPLRGLADAIFARVEAGEIRVAGAFALARLVEVLIRLQQAHTWLTNDGRVQPTSLAPWFLERVQAECEVPEFRDVFNARCGWYAGNRYYSAAQKRQLREQEPDIAGYLDDVSYQTRQRELGQALMAQDGEGYRGYWKPEGNERFEECYWHRLVKQAEAQGLIEQVGCAERSLDVEQDEERHKPITLWSLKAARLFHEARVRPPRPRLLRNIRTAKYETAISTSS